jgi:hypothetical protein
MTPDAFNGNPAKAESFWNALENYYTLNDAVYTNEGQKVAATLTHFKMGTSARDWASDHLATALGATPITPPQSHIAPGPISRLSSGNN